MKEALTKEQTRLKLLSERERKLYIEDIPTKLTKEEFQNHFSKYGEIESLRVIHEKRKNGTQKNFAFVLFKDKISLQKSVEISTLHKINGFEIDCKPTKLREELKEIQLKKQKTKKCEGKKSKKGKKKKKKKKNNPNSKKKLEMKEEKIEKKVEEQPKQPEEQKKFLRTPTITISSIPINSPPNKPSPPEKRSQPSKTSLNKESNNILKIPYIDPNQLITRNAQSNSNLSAELTYCRPSYKNKSHEPKEKNYFHLGNMSSYSEESKEFSKNSNERERSDTILTKQFIETALKGYGRYRMIPHETYSQTSFKSGNDSNFSNPKSYKSIPLNMEQNYAHSSSVLNKEKDENQNLFRIIEEERGRLENASTQPVYDHENRTVFTSGERGSVQPKKFNMSTHENYEQNNSGKNLLSRLKSSHTANSSELLGFKVSKQENEDRDYMWGQGRNLRTKSKFAEG